jgi:hypothetical protein
MFNAIKELHRMETLLHYEWLVAQPTGKPLTWGAFEFFIV